jgi:hypothetical protein
LLLLGLYTGWDVTLNQPSIKQSAQHLRDTSALALDAAFEQLHSKACTKAATLHLCVLTQTHILWVLMVMRCTAWQTVQTNLTATSSLSRENTKLTG